jgi:HEAT repeat protein
MVAELKKGLASGMPLQAVVARLSGDYSRAGAYVYALVKLLDDPKVDRSHVLVTLASMDGDSAVVVPAVVKYLQKKKELNHNRQWAVKALARHEQRGVPALLDILKTIKEVDQGEDAGVRAAALWALGNLEVNRSGRDVKALMLVLGPAATNKEADVRRAAITTIGRFQVRDEKGRMLPHPGMRQLLAALKDDDAKVRELAAKALGDARGGPDDPRPIIAGLLKLALSDHQDESRAAPRWVAIHSLALMGDQGIKPLLGAPWGDRDVHIRAALIQALATTTNKSPVALRFLLDNLGDHYAIRSLAQINYGDAARAAVPSLTESLKSGSEFARSWALEALFTVGPTGPIGAAAALKDSNSTWRLAILRKLMEKVRSREIVPALIPCLEDQSAPVRALAAELLGKIGPAARAAVKALDNALDDKDPTVRASAREALKRIKQPLR